MATAGPTLPGTGANISPGSGAAWTFPERITSDDTTPASFVNTAAGSQWLCGSAFGWSITAGSTISNILVELDGSASSDENSKCDLYDGTTEIEATTAGLKGFTGSTAWRTVYNADPPSGFDSAVTGNTDVYRFRVTGTGFGVSWTVDAMRVTITYTLPSGGPSIKVSRTAAMRAANR